jgi:type 1 glutamine amidotransferase
VGGASMSRRSLLRTSFFIVALCLLCAVPLHGQKPRFRVLAFYTNQGEPDHVAFAHQALPFFSALAEKDGFDWEATDDWRKMSLKTLKQYQLVVWLDDLPSVPAERSAFRRYMEQGGGWLGFHISGYNDDSTHWPWFVHFMGTVFYRNSWPPLPAVLKVDDPTHPIAKSLPASYLAPASEWYVWQPDPRSNPRIKVLLTLDPSNYPLGMKDTLVSGDLPVVWTNTQYRMVYMNMGHGDKNFTSATQNRLFENAILWLGAR